MREKSERPSTAEQHVRDIRRATRRKWSSEEKIRIVLSGLRGEYSIAERCRRETLDASLRNIADTHLHLPIRSRDKLPTITQVNFRQDLDVLLQEVVRQVAE